MPLKLILAIIYVVAGAVFAGFNLDNKTNIWLYHTFTDVPVFLIALGGIGIGLLISLPYVLLKDYEITEADVRKFEAKKQRKLEKQRKIEEKRQKAVDKIETRNRKSQEKILRTEKKEAEKKLKSEKLAEKKKLKENQKIEKEAAKKAKQEAKVKKMEEKASIEKDNEIISSETVLNAI